MPGSANPSKGRQGPSAPIESDGRPSAAAVAQSKTRAPSLQKLPPPPPQQQYGRVANTATSHGSNPSARPSGRPRSPSQKRSHSRSPAVPPEKPRREGEGGHSSRTASSSNAGPEYPKEYITVSEAMDTVSQQCLDRGLQHAALWLSELSLDAVSEVLQMRLPVCAPSSASSHPMVSTNHSHRHPNSGDHQFRKVALWPTATLALDEPLTTLTPSSATGADAALQRLQRHHRAALSLLHNREYQRCHHLLTRLEQELKTERDERERGEGTSTAGVALPPSSSIFPPPVLPSCLQFLRLYALYLDGEKTRMTNRGRTATGSAGGLSNAVSSGGVPGTGGGQAPSPAAGAAATSVGWLHPNLRELRSMLHEALDVHAVPQTFSSVGTATSTSQRDRAQRSSPPPYASGAASRTSGSSASWHPTQMTSSGQPSQTASSCSSAGAKHQTTSPTPRRQPPVEPDVNASAPHEASSSPSPSAHSTMMRYDVASSSRHRPDPYLLWLMGVVLREMQAPLHEYTSFFYASLAINPLFSSAWEDLSRTLESEADVAAAVRRLGQLRPSFMLDIFAASVRTTLGTLPMSNTSGSGATGSPLLEDGGEGHSSPGSFPSSGSLPLAAAPAVRSVSLNAWEQLLLQFPHNAGLLTQLAEAKYYLEKNAVQAEKIYAALQLRDPFRLEHTPMYSNLLFLKPDPLGLCSLAQRVYRIDPFRSQSNMVVGNYYCCLREHERSIFHFRRALAVDPTVVTAWTLLGQAYLEHKNIQAALDAFRCAVELDRRDYRGWYNLGHSYELLSVFHRARFYYARAAQLRPSDSRMWRALASCFRKEKQESAALQCLERAEACEAPASLPLFYATSSSRHLLKPPPSGGSTPSPAANNREYIGILEDLAEYYRSHGVRALNEKKDFGASYRLLRRAGVYYHKLFSVLGGATSSYAQPVALRLADSFVLSAQALLLATTRGSRTSVTGNPLGTVPLPAPGTAGSSLPARGDGFSPSEEASPSGVEEGVEQLLDYATEWMSLLTGGGSARSRGPSSTSAWGAGGASVAVGGGSTALWSWREAGMKSQRSAPHQQSPEEGYDDDVARIAHGEEEALGLEWNPAMRESEECVGRGSVLLPSGRPTASSSSSKPPSTVPTLPLPLKPQPQSRTTTMPMPGAEGPGGAGQWSAAPPPPGRSGAVRTDLQALRINGLKEMIEHFYALQN